VPFTFFKDRIKGHFSFFLSVWSKLCTEHKIKHKLAIKGRAQADAQSESSIQTLIQYIQIYWRFKGSLKTIIRHAEFAANNSTSKATKFSLFRLLYSFNPHSPEQKEKELERETADHQKAEKNILKYQDNMQKHCDKKHRDPPKYSIGQLVWLDNEDFFNRHSRNKFWPKFIGP
jgi:hypothetical protein